MASPPETIGGDLVTNADETGTRAHATVVKASIGGGAVAVSVVLRLAQSVGSATRPLRRAVSPLARVLMSPPGAPTSLTPEAGLRHLVLRGSQAIDGAERALDLVARDLVPMATDAVVKRVDLPRILDTLLDQIDITDLAIQRVDLDRLLAEADLNAAIARLDVDAVAARLDLTALTARLGRDGFTSIVSEAADLPESIVMSTGSVAGKVVRGAGKQGGDAYGQVRRAVDRVPLPRAAQAPTNPEVS
jgi:hypothetical protein